MVLKIGARLLIKPKFLCSVGKLNRLWFNYSHSPRVDLDLDEAGYTM
jgi:hypothetical protein